MWAKLIRTYIAILSSTSDVAFTAEYMTQIRIRPMTKDFAKMF